MENNENNFQNQANDVQKENEKNANLNNNGSKKVTISLMVIILILVLGIGVGGGFLISKIGNNNTNTAATKSNTVNSIETKSSKKIDESKPWVYDAEYCINNEKKMAYGAYEGEEYSSAERLKVPYININSDYAKKCNEEIKDLYDKEYDKFGEKSGTQSYIGELEFEWYNTDKILSVAIQSRKGWTNAGWGGEYIIYNINLDTLNEASYEEVYKECGFSSLENVKEKAEIALLNEIDKSEGGLDGTVLKYDKYFISKDGLNFLIPNAVGNPIPLIVKSDTTRKEPVKINKDDNKSNLNTGITIKEDFFSLQLPSNWNGKYKYDLAVGSGRDNYIFTTKSDNAELFSVIRSSYELKGEYGTSLIEKDDYFYYYFRTPTDTPSNTSEYAELYKDVKDIKNTVKFFVSNSKTDYSEKYAKIIDEVVVKHPDSDLKCDLIYFNYDNIPDLVIGLPGYWVSLYIYENGTVYNPIEEWAYGAMGNAGYAYLEKKAIVSNHNSDFAGAISTDSIIILNSNNKFDYLAKRGVGADLEPTHEMYEAVQKDLAETGGYYYNDKKISEEEYNNKLKELSIDSNAKFKSLDGSKSIEEVKKQLQ